METTLHRELKLHYAADPSQTEVRLGRFRIDAVADGELIEVQHGSLAAIRDKVRRLSADHALRVVKPIVVAKRLVKLARRSGPVVERRQSPRRGGILDLFHELVYFTKAFPHRNLTLEVPLVEIEEWRYPGHGKRRRRGKRDHVVEDQRLIAVRETHRFRQAADLRTLLPAGLASPFDTGDLAAAQGVDRWIAQRIAYVLRKTGAARPAGKRGNAILYSLVD